LSHCLSEGDQIEEVHPFVRRLPGYVSRGDQPSSSSSSCPQIQTPLDLSALCAPFRIFRRRRGGGSWEEDLKAECCGRGWRCGREPKAGDVARIVHAHGQQAAIGNTPGRTTALACACGEGWWVLRDGFRNRVHCGPCEFVSSGRVREKFGACSAQLTGGFVASASRGRFRSARSVLPACLDHFPSPSSSISMISPIA